MASGRLIASVAIVVAVSLAATACGRRGPLDTPYEAAVEARQNAIDNALQPVPPDPTPPVVDRPFILDRLL